MNRNHNDNQFSSTRRRLIENGVKLALLSTVISPIIQSCNNKTKNAQPGQKDTSRQKTSANNRSKRKRQKWLHESLVVNSKTGVMHLPSSKIYHYYDEIKSNHIKQVALLSWAAQLNESTKLNKQQSGKILEVLALSQLRAEGITDQSLGRATDILARAFSPDADARNGKNLNETNFRVHELMLQLVAMNDATPVESKYQVFLSKVKKPAALRKRQHWMASQAAFDERVKYIKDRENDYKLRLTKRAQQYSFT